MSNEGEYDKFTKRKIKEEPNRSVEYFDRTKKVKNPLFHTKEIC